MLKCVLIRCFWAVDKRLGRFDLTLDLALDPVIFRYFYYFAANLDLSVTKAPILPFEAYYVIMHKV